MGRLRRTIGAVSVGILVTAGLVAGSAGSAGASAILDNDKYVVPATTIAGADTGFVFSQTGPTSDYTGSNERVVLPPGMVMAHADTRPGVPTSPIENRPTQGDVVGSLSLTSMVNGLDCNTATTRSYRFVWHEWSWNGGYDPMKVAEIGVEFEYAPGQFSDFSGMGVYLNVRLTGEVDGLPTYEITIPSSATQGFFCAGSYYRQTGVMGAPWGKTLARNAAAPGVQTICSSALSNSGQPVGYCSDFTLEAADGTSTTLAAPAECTISGTDGPDVITGTSGDDVICAFGGDDRIVAGSGNDLVIGGEGNDRINGGNGDDALDGGSGSDRVNGGADSDLIYGGSGDDVLSAATGDDFVNGGSGDDRVTGGTGDDVVEGGLGADKLMPGSGNDQAIGGPGADTIAGSAGNDSVSGGDGPDNLAGNAGSDLVYGGPDADTCKAEPIADLGIVSDC